MLEPLGMLYARSGKYWCVAWLPPWNPHKTKPAVTFSLDWAAIREGAPARFFCHVQVACSDPFLSAKGSTPIDIHLQLSKVYGPWCLDVTNVRKWVREFMYGCTDIHDEHCSGWPLVSIETIAKVEQEMLENRSVSVHELCEQIPEPAQLGRRFLWQGCMKNATAYAKVHRSQRWLHRKIAESPAFTSV